MVDGGKSAEENLAKIGEDGGAAGGDAVLDKEDGDLGEESVTLGRRLESREQADKGRGEVFVGGLALASHMTETEAGGRVQCGKAAAATGGSVMAAAVGRYGG